MAKNKGNQAADSGTDGGDTALVEPGADVRTAELEAEIAKLREELAAANAKLDAYDVESEKTATAWGELKVKHDADLAEIDRLSKRVAELETASLPPAPPAATAVSPTRWEVSIPGHRHPKLEIEAASAKEAVEQYKIRLGITVLPVGAEVTPLE